VVPSHPSALQKARLEWAFALAVNVTLVSGFTNMEHVVVQLIPEGTDVTEPGPKISTVSLRLSSTTNDAATSREADIVTWHWVPEPVQSPDQPAKVPRGPDTAVSVTRVFGRKPKSQTYVAQERPPGFTVTEPTSAGRSYPTVGWRLTRSNSPSTKAAVTERAWLIVTTHGTVVPVHAPLQPVKIDAPATCGTSDTTDPSTKSCVHES